MAVAVAMAVGYNARHLIRHMRVCARHRRALRACSPFPVPSAHERHARVAAAVALARALSIACTRCGVAMAVEVAVGCTAYDARHSRCASLSRARASSSRVVRVITVFRSPCARPARACGGCGGARSLARSRAAVVDHVARRARRASRAYTRVHARVTTVHRARHHRFPSPMSPTHPHARTATAAALSCLLARTVALAVAVGAAVAVELAVPPKGYGVPTGVCGGEQARAMSLCACAYVTAPLVRVGGGGARSLAHLPLRRSPRRRSWGAS